MKKNLASAGRFSYHFSRSVLDCCGNHANSPIKSGLLYQSPRQGKSSFSTILRLTFLPSSNLAPSVVFSASVLMTCLLKVRSMLGNYDEKLALLSSISAPCVCTVIVVVLVKCLENTSVDP